MLGSQVWVPKGARWLPVQRWSAGALIGSWRTPLVLLTASILVVALAWMAEPAAAVSTGPAPGCQGTPDDPEIGDLCPDDGIPDEFSVSVNGDIGSGAAVDIAPSVSPCSSQDAGTGIFSPDDCYSRILIEAVSDPICAYQDSYDDGVDRPSTREGKPAYQCSYYLPSEPLPGSMLWTDWANVDYRLGLTHDNCTAGFNEAYVNGGPPGDTWSTRGPAALTCTYQRPAQAPNGDDTEPDGLYGPTWIRGTATLHIEHSDGTHSVVGTPWWIPVDGIERPRPPVAAFVESKTAAATYEFLSGSYSQWGDPMSYDWTFEAADDGDPYTVRGSSHAEQPEFTFDYGKYANVTLEITDSVNGMTDSVQRSFTIDGSGPPPPPPPGDLPVVTVEATDASAAEAGPDTGTWTLSRTKTAGELTVNVSTSGTASEGSDYTAVADTATFPAGDDTVDVTLTPVDAPPIESAEVATMTVDPGNGYTVGDPSTGDITIADDDGGGDDQAPDGNAKVKGKPKAGKAIKIKASSNEAGVIVAKGTVIAKKSGKRNRTVAFYERAVVSGKKRKNFKLNKDRANVAAGETVTLNLKVKGKKNAKLRRLGKKKKWKTKAKLDVVFRDAAGNDSSERLKVELR